jgi:hypothetical protein
MAKIPEKFTNGMATIFSFDLKPLHHTHPSWALFQWDCDRPFSIWKKSKSA